MVAVIVVVCCMMKNCDLRQHVDNRLVILKTHIYMDERGRKCVAINLVIIAHQRHRVYPLDGETL